jgi:hypothetical protein
MRKKLSLLLLLAMALLVQGCAKNVLVRYGGIDDGPQFGTIVVKLSEPMSKVSITVDNINVVEDKTTKRVTIENVPSGKRHIHVIAQSSERKDSLNREIVVDVRPNQENTVLIEVPPYSTGSYVLIGILVLICWLPLL